MIILFSVKILTQITAASQNIEETAGVSAEEMHQTF